MSVAWKLRGCPRCGGDLFINSDMNREYEQCLQCSYARERNNPADSKKQPVSAGAANPKRDKEGGENNEDG